MKSTRHTLDDIATALGLSPNTVSRALRGRDGVSERTRQLVLSEAVKVGYVIPQQHPTTGVDTIAVTVPSATHTFAAQLLAAIESGVRAAGYSLDLYATEELPEQEQQIAEQIIASRPSGVIAIPVQGRSHPWAAVQAAGIPVVATTREIAESPTDFIGVDSEAGSYAAARHLIGSGAKRILSIDENLAISTVEARKSGIRRALEEPPHATVDFADVQTRRFENTGPQWRAHEAFLIVNDRLSEDRTYDAVITGDDFFALGALKALQESGRRVPEEVMVVGYGGLPFAEWVSPALSTVDLPATLVGELAVATLLQRVAGASGPRIRRLIRPELKVRASSAVLAERTT
ncbi:LacI family DNA-binding transcriptional regulator [Glutamicibacter mysorens]|uniref:LacI family transcriptional regulator n=1 Tax=Glutamicibacter mysorens TaxID=257984 RepID=A0ABX4N2B9_9MICC|nr:LacI family DNA-binding transcriptional regulator [Glutamicibacter mysorens]PJJ45835.1 LacI family transcriptional regulator [Glutamicibacter mysorens]